ARLRATPSPGVVLDTPAPSGPTPTSAPPPATAAPTAVPSPTALALEDAIALVKHYTAFVWTDEGSRSGVSIGSGRVLTNNHVVQGASTVNVRFADGRQEPV